MIVTVVLSTGKDLIPLIGQRGWLKTLLKRQFKERRRRRIQKQFRKVVNPIGKGIRRSRNLKIWNRDLVVHFKEC